jgi:hypothetical protein
MESTFADESVIPIAIYAPSRAEGPIHNSLGRRPRFAAAEYARAESPTHALTIYHQVSAFIGVDHEHV